MVVETHKSRLCDPNEIADSLMIRYTAGLHKLAVILLVFFDNNNKVSMSSLFGI